MIDTKQKELESFIQNELNEQQRKAVKTDKGSLLVIAGAGSGKTRVITTRIAYLIVQHNIHPRSILALTFTNKAAKEMQERISHFLQDHVQIPTVATFHSYCLQILKIHQHLLPFDNFVIMDAADQQKLLQSILKKYEIEKRVNIKQLLYTISSYKNRNALGTNIDDADSSSIYRFHEIYNAYEQEKRLSKTVDFDDLLVYTLQLFQTNKEFKKKFQSQIRHILIDEYQDTNTIQNELLRNMVLNFNQELAIDSICAVGDEDQSIYSWRGATVENILKFHTDFAPTQVIKIEQNYRSTQHILDIANHVISQNRSRNHKNLWSERKDFQKTIIFECNSEFQEADTISQLIKIIEEYEFLESVAILYRTHYQSRMLEEALIKASIPYKIIGGIQFYERKEIKDLIAYLKLAYNPFDRISFSRIINCPARGLGQKFEEDFSTIWNQNPLSHAFEIIDIVLESKITKIKQASLLNFKKLFTEITETTTPLQATQYFLEHTHYIEYLEENFDKNEIQVKKENIQEFLRALNHFQDQGVVTISQLLDEITLMQDRLKVQESEKNFVHMMTLHSAKGLEFNTVILPGLEDGIIPSTPSINENNIEEERRLFYVGITRACKRLLITHCKTRNTYGQTNIQTPSRFIDEIPTDLIIEQSANYWSSSQCKYYFKQWIHGNNLTAIDNQHVQTFTYQKSVAPTMVQKLNASSSFKRMQTVQHKLFGLGIVHEIEDKGSNTIVTVKFHTHGLKKIDSKFLQKI